MAARTRVAVIGAGLAGLCTARCLAEASTNIDFVVFEKNSMLGGIWVYDDRETTAFWSGRNGYVKEDDDNFTSCMYKNLRINLPKEIMAIPEYPYSRHLDSFVTHGQVLSYLESFASDFKLLQFIKFNHVVQNVKRLGSDKSEQWNVSVTDTKTGVEASSIFDAVVVCNGHFSKPLFPYIDGLSNFKGIQLHSRFYRRPEAFKDMNIIVVGASASGLDIAVDLSAVAKTITISHDMSKRIKSKLPSNIQEFPLISSIAESGEILFQDGAVCTADVILFCTGYEISFPFLDKNCDIIMQNNTVRCLYKHIFHYKYPSLTFIGLNKKIVPASHFHVQASAVKHVLLGKASLPSEEDMMQNTKKEIEYQKSIGFPPRYFHVLLKRKWAYLEDLCNEFGCKILPKGVVDLETFVEDDRQRNLLTYRERNFAISEEEFTLLN